MDARFYNSEDIDIERLAADLVNVYMAQSYQVQQFGSTNQMLVQLKKGGDFEALLGMQAALSLTIQRTAGGVLAMIGQQRWLDKAAVGTVGIVGFPILWPLALTAGVGSLRQASLANQVLNMVDGLVRQQRPGVQVGPIPMQIVPQVQQQWAPYPSSAIPVYEPLPQQVVIAQPVPQQTLPAPLPTKLRCPTCNTPYEAGETFCSGCGGSLTPKKEFCANCHTELKLGAAFCQNCGASTFQARSATQIAPTTPAPQAPPTWTPPSAQPTVAAPVQPPSVPYYVPSTPQQPPEPPKPQIYYTPPQQQIAANAPTEVQQFSPIVAKPATQPASDPTKPWGTLIFSEGQQVQLRGERAVVGRYDHDIGGITPEVDLSGMQGADTSSRIHAALEHIGSTYTLTDLNSTNTTRINNKRLEPDTAIPINEGDTLSFGKVTCTFRKV